MKRKVLLALALVTIAFGLKAQSTIIPKPYQEANNTLKSFNLATISSIGYSCPTLEKEAKYLSKQIKEKAGVEIVVAYTKDSKENSILLSIDPMLAKEAYTIDNNKGLVCTASTPQAVFFAIQSLLQSIEGSTIKISSIKDIPRYGWRGYMLDEARHFHGKEVVKNILDAMAHLKMNIFHWHLTDEDGWRIEIKKYPKLTEIGAVGSWSDKEAPRKFYTQEEIKEIIDYAAERHIMVIPEIDMPGHATAISKAYPEISGGGEGRWKGFTYHPTKETTYEFIENVFDEVFALFPSPYIHVGGDEVHFGNQSWSTDPQIVQFIADNNLGDAVGLEHYFIRRVAKIVNSKGRKMIGWDEIINSGITPEQAIVMWWRHDKPQELTRALGKGFDVIMTPRIPCYLDFVQDESQEIGRRWGKAFVPVAATHAFPKGVESNMAGYEDQILGMQANTWTERMSTTGRLYYMIFPRLSALSEAAWTVDENKDFGSYEQRLKPFLLWLDNKGINYFNPFDKESTPEPWGPTKHDVVAEG